jgi:hypothetical protein
MFPGTSDEAKIQLNLPEAKIEKSKYIDLINSVLCFQEYI